MKKLMFILGLVVLISGVLAAREKAADKADEGARRHGITDPEVYIPLREEMTRMEMKFVDIQIMAAEDKVNFLAVRKALEQMEVSAKKIRDVNPRDALREPLAKLSGQISGLKGDARRKDRDALKANLDRLFETCFKCHQSHAPLM